MYVSGSLTFTVHAPTFFTCKLYQNEAFFMNPISKNASTTFTFVRFHLLFLCYYHLYCHYLLYRYYVPNPSCAIL